MDFDDAFDRADLAPRLMREPIVRFDADGAVIAASGARLPRISWRSDLERRLTLETERRSRASALADLTLRIPDTVPPEAVDALQRWLVAFAPFVAIASAPRLRDSFVAFESSLRTLQQDQPAIVDDLFARLADGAPARTATPVRRRRRKVLVLSSSHGGGNQSVSAAVTEFLTTHTTWDAEQLDIHQDVIRDTDAIHTVFGVRETDVWNRVMADERDLARVEQFRRAQDQLHDFAPNLAVEQILDAVKRREPDVIILTISGYTKLAQVAELAPTAILHTDFCFNAKLVGENPYATFNACAVRGASLCELADIRRLEVWLTSDDHDFMLERARAKRGADHHRLFRAMGYPVRRAFVRPRRDQVMRAREVVGLRPDERLVLLMMGQEGRAEHHTRLVVEIARHAATLPFPILLVAVCGRSRRAFEALTDRASILEDWSVGRLRLQVESTMDGDRLAAHLIAASQVENDRPGLVITKSGGATTAECVATGTYMLCVDDLAWERPNFDFAARHGWAERVTESELTDQIARLVTHPPGASEFTPIDWRPRVRQALVRVLGDEERL